MEKRRPAIINSIPTFLTRLFSNPTRRTCLIFSSAFLIRSVFVFLVFLYHPTLLLKDPDTREYTQIAENLISQHTFSLSSGEEKLPTSFRTPLYPIFLAGTNILSRQIMGEKHQSQQQSLLKSEPHDLGQTIYLLIVIVLQAVIGSFSCVFTYWLGREVFSERAGIFAAAGLAVEPLSIAYTGILLTETLFTFLLLASVFYFIRHQTQNSERNRNRINQNKHRQGGTNLILSGVSLGLAALCRPIGLYLVGVFIFWLYLWGNRKKLRYILMFFLLYLLTISPWLIRNTIVFNTFHFASVQGYDLLFYHAAMAEAIRTRKPLYQTISELKTEMIFEMDQRESFEKKSATPEVKNHRDHLESRGEERITIEKWNPEMDKIASEIAMQHLIAHPFTSAKIQFQGVISLFLDSPFGISLKEKLEGKATSSRAMVRGFFKHHTIIVLALEIIFWAYLLLIYMSATLGLIQINEDQRRWSCLFLLMIAALAIPAGPMSTGRFRIPFFAYVLLFSGNGFVTILKGRFILKRKIMSYLDKTNGSSNG